MRNRAALLLFLLLLVFACERMDDPQARRLVRTEALSYTGYVLRTEYGYDMQGRMNSITQYMDDEAAHNAITISYEGNQAILFSNTHWDPSYNSTSRVVLTLSERGTPQKRIEYIHSIDALGDGVQPPEKFFYDTMHYEYDGMGFLAKTKRSIYDSSYVSQTQNSVRRWNSNATYTTESGNLTAVDEYIVYHLIQKKDGTINNITGGSSERHDSFIYTEAYPNKTDFSNAAILNESRQHFEPILSKSYKNMPNQVISRTTDRDLDDVVFFNIESTREMERTYNEEGLLSSVKIPERTQFREVIYYYK